ncbi:hypothetical protein QFZ30_000775 [Arthrobacter pascens]|uniref:hypothetical protein n=1 Tax=Arthrobacter pascens TaxID=1677 RepID=UPI00278CC6EC|nr:hypothetical protein [Arthrobacter pascens]MDQ0677393.1 hypothetical protein [Arthrobacter pascens]
MTTLPEHAVLADFTMDLDELGPDLHTEARSVAGRTRHAQDAFEVAVILGTLGYSDQRARELGCRDVFDLAEKVMSLLPLFGGPADERPVGIVERSAEDTPGPERMSPGLLLRSVLYSAPWIVAVVALVVARVSFWSTITAQQFSTAISLALFVGLVVTGGFMQAFARRGVFYALQHNGPLLRWTLRWTLGVGLAVLLAIVGAGYVVLEFVLDAYTPAANRSFLLFGISIGVMLLAFSPLYLARAFWSVLAAAGTGGLVAVLGGWSITEGNYLNLYTAQWVQLGALWTAVLVAVVFDVRIMRRLGAAPAGTTQPDARDVRSPRLPAVVRAVYVYWLYGTGFFVLIVVDQMVAGGLWQGVFNYNGYYELAVGTGLLILIPTLTYATAASYLLPATVQREVRRHLVSDSVGINRVLMRFYVRHVLLTLLVGLVSGAVLLAATDWLSTASLVTSGLNRVVGIYVCALVGYLLLGVGALNSGLLFSLGQPRVPALAVWTGVGVSLVVGLTLSWVWVPLPGAIIGLISGSAFFAVATTVAARRMFRRFDLSYYGAF